MQSRAMIGQKQHGQSTSTGSHHLVNPVLFVDAGSGMRVHSFKSSQCHVLCVCKINTISLSYPADSACVPSATEEAAAGTVVESVAKRLRLPSEVKGGDSYASKITLSAQS